MADRAGGLAVWAVALVAALGGPAGGEDWPTDRHDNQRSGVTAERLGPPLSPAWTFRPAFPPAKGWALPVNGYGARKNRPNVSHDDAFRVVVAGETAYLCCSSSNAVYAIDAAAGRIRWTFFTGAAPRLAPVIWRDKLYFGADDGRYYCLDARDGRCLWQIDAAPTDERMLGQGRFSSVWPVRAGAIVEEGAAWFTAGLFPAEGIHLFAVRADDGRVLWRRQLDRGGTDAPSPQGPMLASRDSIFMTSRVAPSRWSKADGHNIPLNTPLPPAKDDAYRFHNGGSDAQIANGRNIVYGQAAILAFDPDKIVVDKYKRPLKGDLLWHWFNARQVLLAGERAYFATDYHVLAVDRALLAELARGECKEFEDAYKSLRVADRLDLMEQYDALVAEHGPDHPTAAWMKGNSLRWGQANWDKWPAVSAAVFEKMRARCAWMAPLVANESMILAGDVIYAGGEDRVVALDAASGKEVWSAATGGRARSLAVANGRLFVSTVDGAVRCFSRGAGGGRTFGPASGPGRDPWPADALTASLARTAREVLGELAAGKGYCLILGAGSARLAREVALAGELSVQAVEPDAAAVGDARTRLAQAGLHGGRVCVEQAAGPSLPYPPYVFNVVIDLASLRGGGPSVPVAELLRVTKPCGGVALVGVAAGAGLHAPDMKVERTGDRVRITRGRLPGSAEWTHNYATAGNTYCSEDGLVKAPFGVLWYGEPGPRKRIDRHAAAPVPLVVNGILFTTGYDLVMAYDVYNGVRYWERRIPGATRTSLPLGTSNLVADETSLFVVVDDRRCLRLDARTGRTLREYPAAAREGSRDNFWGWIAKDGGLLLGSRCEPDERRRRASLQTSEGVFALDVETGGLKWTYSGRGIDHDGIAVGGGRVLLVDRELSATQRQQAVAGTPRDTSVEDRKPLNRKGEPIEPDIRRLVALDVGTGRVLWDKPLNVTDITLDDTAVMGKAGVACMVKDGVVVVHGTGSLGHPHREFLGGEFRRRALYAFAADTGALLWGGRRNYRKRPIIVGDCVYAEPYAWDLKTGRPKTLANPLSGEQQPLDFHRGYIGCGHLLASGAALFGARGGMACWNLDERTGFAPFANMELGCGLDAVPACGVFAAPESRSGCTCATPIYTSIALYPRERARAWGMGVTGGLAAVQSLPVRHAFINLGAPGYREEGGRLWVPYAGRGRAGMGIIGSWLPAYQHDASMFYLYSGDLLPIVGTDRPWLYTSGYRHGKALVFPLLAKGDPPATYTVRLHFAEPEDLGPGGRVFSVSLQGRRVLTDFDIVKEAGGARRAVVREFRGVVVTGSLEIVLAPAAGAEGRPPVLCALEAIRD